MLSASNGLASPVNRHLGVELLHCLHNDQGWPRVQAMRVGDRNGSGSSFHGKASLRRHKPRGSPCGGNTTFCDDYAVGLLPLATCEPHMPVAYLPKLWATIETILASGAG